MQAQFELFWQAGDAVTHSVFWVLLVMSLLSWTAIFYKSMQFMVYKFKAASQLQKFWQAPDWSLAYDHIKGLKAYQSIAYAGYNTQGWLSSHQKTHHHLADALPHHEVIVQSLRGALNQANSRLEQGQTLLASIGSTAPFVGLFGTVWGIYHALMNIGQSGQLGLDQVAGPVGEALIMTALGLFVAIPAVLAYNAFNRQLRMLGADLDGFAHDLHLYFMAKQSTSGTPVNVQEKV